MPTFEFLHCHGLGVAVVGAKAPAAVRKLCELDGGTVSVVRERFAHFGARWMAAVEQGEVGRKLQSLEQDLTVLRDAHARTIVDLEEKAAWAQSVDKELKDLREAHTRTVADGEEKAAWGQSLDKELNDLRDAYARTVADREGDLSQARAAHARLTEQYEKTVSWAKSLNNELTEARAVSDRTMAERDQAAGRIDTRGGGVHCATAH